MHQYLVMVAKEPIPGRCKTRLCPPLDLSMAAALYECFLRNLTARLQGLVRPGRSAGIAYTTESDPAYFGSRVPADFRLMAQEGPDLGTRLPAVARICLREPGDRVVILSSDSPTLPPAFLESAFDELERHDVVLGPCDDGGYYLVGLRAYTTAIFERITWSTERVLRETLERAETAGLSVGLLPAWYDIDTATDLERLRAALTLEYGPPLLALAWLGHRWLRQRRVL